MFSPIVVQPIEVQGNALVTPTNELAIYFTQNRLSGVITDLSITGSYDVTITGTSTILNYSNNTWSIVAPAENKEERGSQGKEKEEREKSGCCILT
jgi:hypothetical protein